eukprot:30294-Pelagococcus_subviridis.AAC.23
MSARFGRDILFAATTWRLAALFATGRAATLRDTGVARTTVLNPGSSTERSEELDGQRRGFGVAPSTSAKAPLAASTGRGTPRTNRPRLHARTRRARDDSTRSCVGRAAASGRTRLPPLDFVRARVERRDSRTSRAGRGGDGSARRARADENRRGHHSGHLVPKGVKLASCRRRARVVGVDV